MMSENPCVFTSIVSNISRLFFSGPGVTYNQGGGILNIDDRYDIGSWAFLGFGWWVSHIAAVLSVGYLGYYLRKMVRE